MVKGDDDLGGYHRWCGRATWCSLRRRCWRADAAKRRCGLWYISPVRSIRTAASRRISGSTGRRTGRASNWTRWRFRLCWRGGYGGNGATRTRAPDVFPFVERAWLGSLVRYALITQQERWEENAGYSPSKLAAVIAGLVCAADLAARAHHRRRKMAMLPGGLRGLD